MRCLRYCAAMTSEPSFVVAVAVVVQHGDRVLALRRAASKDVGAGIWETVSGRVEGDESLEEAAHREVREETGRALSALRGPIDAYRMLRGTRHMVVVVYAGALEAGAIDVEGLPSIARSAEHDAHAWRTREELASSMPPRLFEAVSRVLDDPARS